ncbi:hypothetical protein CROQUDRAFT_100196 [Cronartium quercuum f. sp. fusiforme G11]|uniref:Uncharacterized protein n=1 Tax=Cronartium quercuum f. sp. fusiforme G11 TaxID=708437 RepID=A0A9P6T7F1_9BASI|nr:hypothetical protein CROQUDRAFT_100196 [Cronartium quercuum f. sp. fusiforme G11]
MVINLQSVTKVQSQAPSAYRPSQANVATHPAPNNLVLIPPAITAQLDLLGAYFKDWKLT